jgi:hypothetical protein
MPEPTSSGVAGAAAAYKAIGGAAGAAASGATLAAVVVSSICGGAITVEYFQLHHWAFSTIGLYAMGGVIFACGLPGWALVRWLFNFIEQRRDETIDEVARDVKELF